MNDAPQSFEAFLSLPDRDRRDVFEAAASRLGTPPGYVEKDFWVCLVLETLYNRMPEGHPRLLFKGGTSLSKVFDLIRRLSEDIDLVIRRDDLGFEGDRDPTVAEDLSNNARKTLFDKIKAKCSNYVLGAMASDLAAVMVKVSPECTVRADEDDVDASTLLLEYPALYPGGVSAYVAPRVKIEAGARSALDPTVIRDIAPLVAYELPEWLFDVRGLRVITAERTYWEKLLILHGLHCGHRDEGRVPKDRNGLSRHYYDGGDDHGDRDRRIRLGEH